MANPLVGPRAPGTRVVNDRSAIFQAAKQATDVAKVALPKSLTDAIAAEDVDAFVHSLATLKPSTRADDATFLRLLEAGLNALGTNTKILGAAVNTLFARASGSSVRLATTAESRQSPLLRAMDDGMLLTGVLRHELARYHLEQDSLMSNLKAATSADAPTARRDAILAVEAKVHLATAPDYVAGAIIDAYVMSDAWADAARVFESAHPDFQALASSNDTHAKLLLLTRPASLTPAIVEGLSADLRGSQRLDAALAIKTTTTTAATTTGTRATLLAQAAKDLTAAVKHAPLGVWPAVDLMITQLARGDKPRAHVAAQLVAENALHLHGWHQADAADLLAGAAALTVLGRTAEAAMLLSAAASAPAGDFWAAARAQRACDTVRVGAISGTAGATTTTKAPVPKATSGTATDDAVINKTYGYAATKARVYAGNYRFGGIAHDERFTPENARFFARLLDANGIMKQTDPAAVNQRIDELIRAHNHTREMEDMGSETHKVFDKTVVGLKEVMPGSKVNCATDVAADWLLRLSDCRQHAAIKCAMFETWKAGQRTTHLQGFLSASEKGDVRGAATAMKAVKSLDAMTMRVLEIVVVHSADGKALEEHTANMLLQRGPTGKLQATLADSFYQNLYNLGGGTVTAAVTEQGAVRFESKGLKRSDGAAIHLDTAGYAGDRSRPVGASGLDQLNFRGRQLAGEQWSSKASLQGVDFGALTWLANPQKLTENMVAFGTSMLAAKTISAQVETLVQHCPEMLWLTGNSRATPEALAANVKDARLSYDDDAATVELWLKAPQFANNAMGSVLLCALANGDYEGFTHCQKDAVRLTKASFDVLASDVRASLTRIGSDAAPQLKPDEAMALGLATLTYYATFKDLPKLEATRKVLEESLGGDVAASPEALLHKVLGRQLRFLTDPSSFNADSQALAMKALIAAPTFETLALGTRKAVVGAFGADFNLGQMLQLLEFPAVKLAELAKLPGTERELVDVEGLMDIASVKGSVVRDGSATITEDYYRRYTAAKQATQATVGGTKSPVDAFNGLFDALTPGLGLDPKNPTDLVIGKIAVALQATTPAFCTALRDALAELPVADRALLIAELAENGLARRAIIPRNLPALMRNLERSEPATNGNAQASAALNALKAVLPLLREVRAHVDANATSGGGTYQIDLLALAGLAATAPERVRAGAQTSWEYGADGATLRVG